MAVYNRTKRLDREREIADLQAEIDAIDAGKWPRDINDQFRWSFVSHDPAGYARRMCASSLAYLIAVPDRIANGELPGWEA